MTVCNMSIEAGAKAGLIAPDETTFAYLEGRAHAPKGERLGGGARRLALAAHRRGRHLRQGGRHRRRRRCARHVSWGTNPGQVDRASTDACPTPTPSPTRASATPPRRALRVHGPHRRHPAARTCPSTPCSSARAPTAASRTCGPPPPWPRAARSSRGVRAMVVPGSFAVKDQAEAEGLDKVFTAAGFDWREPGCSMCLAMNPDKLAPGERSPPPRTATSRAGRARAGAPTWCRPPSPPPPPSPAPSPTPATWTERDQWNPSPSSPARAVPLDRSDVDTDQIIPSDWLKRVERTGFGAGPVLRVARRPATSCSTVPQFGERQHPRRRPQLRHRLDPRARRLGDQGLRLRGRDLAPLRRHLPQQLPPRTASCRSWCRPRWPSRCCGPSRPTRRSRSPSTSSAAGSTAPAIGIDVDVPARRLHPAALPRRASTTSASPSATRTRSPPSRPPARPGCPPPPQP